MYLDHFLYYILISYVQYRNCLHILDSWALESGYYHGKICSLHCLKTFYMFICLVVTEEYHSW